MKTYPFLAAALAAIALALVPASAATMSASSNAPVINGEDIANYGGVSTTDKWFTGSDGAARGQSFTTGGAAVRLKAISYQVSEDNGAAPTKNYTLRVGKVAGTTFTQVHSETATQTFSWTGGQFMTWTFNTPVLLEPYTTYGIDIGMTSSTTSWSTGIPYINITADEYAGGTSYTSGTNGIGTTSLNSAIASDRTFHLDIERPLDPVFSLVTPSPADNSTDAFASREMVMSFSQTVTPGAGNLTIRNLTDGTDTVLAANDSRLTYDQNVVRINPTGLLTWNKNYAIRIDAGIFLGDGGAQNAAITDDTTWNFTTIAADPLLTAIAALKAHILNTTPLTLSQIAAHKTTIDNQRQRFAENTVNISAVFDLITTYDTAKGPLFVGGFANNSTSFNRDNLTTTSKNSVTPENYHWVIYTVMQHTMDLIFTAENLAKYEATLTNYKFGSHTAFPGPCSPPANPSNTHSVQINGSFPVTFGRGTQNWNWPARKPTGTYLAPGTIASVTVPAALVNAGYKIRVGAHSWDLSGRKPVNRLERATRLFAIDATTTKIASPYGGGIYIEVPQGASAGPVTVTVTGAVRAPYFSAKSFHQTTATEWDTERTHPAPWADFQSDKFMMQVPRKWIYNMTGAQATQLMVDWDKAMDAINSLMGFPLIRGKETMYCQVDIITRSSVFAPGYPAVNNTGNPNSEVSPAGYSGNYLVRGPGASSTAANVEFHEQGHAYAFPKFGGESESNVNLLFPAALNRKFGYSFDVAHAGSLGKGAFHSIDNTAIAWMCCFSFSPNEIPMAELEKQYQHKGHAKFMDIARLFGWNGLDTYWRSFQEDDANNISYANTDDAKMLRLCRSVGKDIRPLFHFWGVHPQNPSSLAAAIAAENIPASPEIRDLLLHYKSLVIPNNAAYQAFMLNWWGRKPSVAGYWEETDHAMQWDETLDADRPEWASVRPEITIGSKYVEGCAADIRARVDELVDLYFPSGMTPNTMSFATAPTVLNATTITMTATTVTAANPPVQYYFENTTNSTNSGWLSTPTWQQTGLTPGSYSYRVKARDALNTENNWSPVESVNLTPAGDITPPSPSPMTFVAPPAAEDIDTISMTAITATDANSVQYDFENTTLGTNSGWQNSPAYTQTGLIPGTTYTYIVRARDAALNTTTASAPASAITPTPDLIAPTLFSTNPANGEGGLFGNVNLVATFNEPIAIGTGNITLKNLTDGTQADIAVTDATQVSVSGAVLTINPTANLMGTKNYAVQIAATAIEDFSGNRFDGILDDATWSFAIATSGSGSTWTYNGADATGNTWTTAGSWLDSEIADGADSTATFILDITAARTITLGGNRTIGNIAFTDTASSHNLTISSNTLTLDVTTGAPIIGVTQSDRTLTVGSIITGNDGLTKNGLGTLVLSSANTYTGGTNINAGTLRLSNATALGTSAGAVSVASAAALDMNGINVANTNALTLNGSGTGGTGALINTTGTGQYAGAVSLAGNTTIGNTGSANLTFNSTTKLNTNGHTLTFKGSTAGIILFKPAASGITGTGSVVVDGAYLRLVSGGGDISTSNYTGTTTVINGGTILYFNNNIGTGNISLDGGTLAGYASAGFTRPFGAGSGQFQITGGESGFGMNGSSTINFSNVSEVQWGSASFNPSKFIVGGGSVAFGGTVTFAEGIDLNGANRTIRTTDTGVLSGVIRNTSGTPASLIKEGGGTLSLSAANTFNGTTTISGGILSLTNASALQNSDLDTTNSVAGTTSAGLRTTQTTLTLGGLIGNKDFDDTAGSVFTTTTPGYSAVTALTLNVGTGNTRSYSGAIGNGAATTSLTKSGPGTQILSGANSYTGTTTVSAGRLEVTGSLGGTAVSINAGTLAGNGNFGGNVTIAAGATHSLAVAATTAGQDTSAITGTLAMAGSTLNLTAASAPAAGVYVLATANVDITGFPSVINYNGIDGTVSVDTASTPKRLLLTVNGSPYDTWATINSPGSDPNEDFDNDGVPNVIEFVLGGLATTKDLSKLPAVATPGGNMTFTFVRDRDSVDPGVIVSIEVGTNLSTWPDIFNVGANTAASTTGVTVSDNLDGTDTIKLTVAQTPDAQKFARLKVVISP